MIVSSNNASTKWKAVKVKAIETVQAYSFYWNGVKLDNVLRF